MTGGWVESYPEDVKAILAAGHDLGNHSENHKQMSQLSDEECKQELMKVHEKVKELTGYDMFLFRPPYGDYDNHVIPPAAPCRPPAPPPAPARSGRRGNRCTGYQADKFRERGVSGRPGLRTYFA